MARSHESSDPGRRMSPDVNPVGQLPGIASLLCALSQPGQFLSFPLSERRIQRSQPNLQRSAQATPGTATSTSDAPPASGQPPSADTPVGDTGAGTDGSGDTPGGKGAPAMNSGTARATLSRATTAMDAGAPRRLGGCPSSERPSPWERGRCRFCGEEEATGRSG
jgi:hypothetical protein